MAMPAFAAPVVQGSNTFTYSAEIDEAVNPVDQTTGEQEYLSLSAPTITFKDLDTIFPDRLSAMAFTASYLQGAKTAIFPGVLALNFTKDQILAYPNGNVIMTALQGSSDPVQTLFQYFDPVIVVNGPDGDTVSYNIKSFLSFNFMAEDNWNAMTVTVSIVPASGYPKGGFFIEDINGYPFIFDTIVSETSQPKAVDGQIEFSLGLVPNGDALGTGITGKYPLMETDNGNGYVIFESPENYLDITEIAAMNGQPAQLSSGTVSFTAIDDGVSFSIPYDNYPGVGVSSVNVFVYMPVSRLEELNIPHEDEESLLDAVSVKIGNYTLSPSGVSMLPDGSAFVSAEFVLVDNDFVSDILVSGDTVIVFDGNNDGRLEATVVVEKKQKEEAGSVPEVIISAQGISVKTLPSLETDASVTRISQVTNTALLPGSVWPGREGFTDAVSVNGFALSYNDTGFTKPGALPVTLSISVTANELSAISSENYNKVIAGEPFFDHFHVFKMIGSEVYDLNTIGGESMFTVTGDPVQRLMISFNAVLVDAEEQLPVVVSRDSFVFYDGEADGELTDPLFIAAVEEQGEEQEQVSVPYSHGSVTLTFDNELSFNLHPVVDVQCSISETTLSLMDKFIRQVAPVAFEGQYQSDTDNNAVSGIWEFIVYGSDLPENVVSAIKESELSLRETVFEYVRPVILAGNIQFDVYDYLQTNGKTDLIGVAGSVDTGIVITVPFVVVDSPVYKVVIDDKYLVIYDGNADGKFVLKSYIGIMGVEEVEKPTVVLESPSLSLKTKPIDIPEDLDVEAIEDIEFEDAGYAEWPNKEGVLGGVFVGSFVGEYDHNLYSKDGAASITVSVSVTPAELKGMFAKGKERYDKMLSEWLAGSKERFLDYYHVYKQIGDEIYDLVLIGGKEVFSLQGDPTTKITISFPAVLIDGEDISPVTFNSDISAFIVYDGKSDGKITDPLFVGAPETVPTAEGETPEEEETKHILPDNPAGPSTGHDDIGKWFKIFSLF